MRSRLLTIAIPLAAGVAVLCGWRLSRPRPDPVRHLFATTIPAWQVSRARGEAAGGEASQRALREAAAWPAVARALGELDAAWPDEERFRDGVRRLDDAARAGALPYWLDVQIAGHSPVALSYAVHGRRVWRAGSRSVEVMTAERLDDINVEMGLLGETQSGTPVVYLDRVESQVVGDLERAWGSDADDPVEAAALARLRQVLDAAPGGSPAPVAEALRARRKLAVSLSQRLAVGRLQLEPPETLVWGDHWFDTLDPLADLTRPGGPLVLESDVRSLRHADENLRERDMQQRFAAVIAQYVALTEAHEARHALEPEDPTPPARLLDEIGGHDPDFAQAADRELRAYLGELHDAEAPACLAIIASVRGVYGKYTRPTPHYFARRVILGELAGAGVAPVELVDRLCDLGDAALRERAAHLRRQLYGAELVPAHAGVGI